MQPIFYAYIKEKKTYYYFKPLSLLPPMTISVPLGQGLINFIWPDSTQEETVFDIIVHIASNLQDPKRYMNIMAKTLLPLAKRSPFLFFIADSFLAAYSSQHPINTISAYLNWFSLDPNIAHEKLKDHFIEWLHHTKQTLDYELTNILSENTDANNLTPIQKLYLLSLREDATYKHLKNLSFQTCLKPTNSYEPSSLSEAITILEDDNPEIVEMYILHTFDELISFELSQMLLHDIKYKKCKCCNKYFIPTGYSNTEYCNRIAPSNQKRCKEIGATLTFNSKHKDDPIHAAYRTAYARMDSRKRQKKITTMQFNQWSYDARIMREKCEQGNISLFEFQTWLDQTRVKK